jgi:hypothetical protein
MFRGWTATLPHVCQFVGNQLSSPSGCRRVFSCAEQDVPAVGVRFR